MVPMQGFLTAFCLLAAITAAGASESDGGAGDCANSPVRIPFASHSHNDYEQSRPLLLALENGMCSIEADFFYINDNSFAVAHEPQYIQGNMTLQSMYLDPLAEIVAANGGRLYPGARYFGGCNPPILMLDVKSWEDAEAQEFPELGPPRTAEDVYNGVHALLESYNDRYPGMFTVYNAESNITLGAINVIVSGYRPSAEHVSGQGAWIGALDLQEPENLTASVSTAVYPLFSIGMDSALGRDVEDAAELTDDDRAKLQELVDQAHAQGRMARFWATPDTPEMWQILFDLELDLIGTDAPAKLREFVFCNDEVTTSPTEAFLSGASAVQASG